MTEPIPERLRTALADRYGIERQLGEGGMATVYLAEDRKHQRKVALKVLRPELAAIVGAERFLAEIRTTANLQHPHILPLFDSGEADGFLFYVMPHVDGETLADRIERERQLPVDEAVRIAVAVANALQAAHDQGVIHRDIKPGNILVSKGEPLVADFGIALAVGAGGGSRLTETGLSIGTPYYMSPEQATGDQQVGPASDTYSLACVLYEMLVGEPPYLGSTAQAVLGRIIQGQPVSVTGNRKAVPANVDAAVRRALEKVPADRFAQVRDFARALGDPAFRHGGDQQSGHRRPASRGVRLAHGAVTVALAALAVWGLFRPERPRATVRFRVDVPASFMPQSLALAPDGSWVIWGGAAAGGGIGGQLWLRRLGELDAVPIAGSAGAAHVAVSPDGGELAFIDQGASELRVVPLEGGVPMVLDDSAICCTAWGSDGFIYFTDRTFTIRRVPAGGGDSEIVVAASETEGRGVSGISTSGKVLFFLSVAMDGLRPTGTSAMRLSDGVIRLILPAVPSVRQLPNGDLAYIDTRGMLLAVPFDEGDLRLGGTPVPIAPGLDPRKALLDVSRSGALAYLEDAGQRGMQPVWVDRDGAVEVIDPDWTFSFNPLSTNRGISLSPDGSRVAVSVDVEGQNDLWIKRLPRGAFSRLTSGDGDETRPRWTADGTSLTYTSTVTLGGVAVIQKADGLTAPVRLGLADVAGGAATEAVVETVAEVQRSPVAPDWFAIRKGLSAGGKLQLAAVRVDAEGREAERRSMETSFNDRAVTISPDGRWIAYESDETGRVEVYVRSFPDVNRRKQQVSASGGRMPAWGATGSEIFFVNDAREMVAVNVRLGEDLRIGEQAALFTIPPDIFVPEGEFYTLYDVDGDDQRFLMLRGADQSSAGIVVVLDPPEPNAPGGGR